MADLSSYINIQANTVKTIGDITPTDSASPAPSISGFDSISGVNLHATTDITAGGNIDIDGEASIGGNLTIIGNITFSGGGSITEVTSAYGNFYGNADGSNALYAGYPGGVVVPGGIASFTGDSNAYMQINAQNRNHGTQASIEYVITGDLGTDTTDYLDIGFASSTWDGTQDNSLGNAVGARDGYMYVQGGGGGGNLILGTTTSGTKIKFNAGGPNAQNTVATISSTGFSAVGNVTAGHFIGEGGNLSNITGSNVTGQVGYAAVANSVAGANVTGAVSYASVANSVAAANVSGLGNVALINKDGNASNVLYGNGSFAAAPGSTYGNSNVVSLLSSFGSNILFTSGNVNAGNVTANTLVMYGGNAGITTTNGSAVSFPGARVNMTGNLFVTGNISAANLGNVSALNLDGNASNILYGNGSFATAPAAGSSISNGTSNVAIATSGGNVVTTVGSAAILTVYSGGIKVAGSGVLQSPGGASSITLNNNGANIPTANITTFANITGASGLNVVANANIGNIGTAGLITATGNITGGNIVASGIAYANNNIVVGSTQSEGGQLVLGYVGANEIGRAHV